MHQLVDTIRKIARHESGQHVGALLAVVKSVHGRDSTSTDHSCTVTLRESGIVLPNVPIATGFIGLTALPREDDVVVVAFMAGDMHAPVIVGRLYDQDVDPPLHGPGEVVVSLPGGEDSDEDRLELRVKTPGDGTRSLTLTLAGDVEVKIEVNDSTVSLRTTDASMTLKQTSSSDATATLAVGGSSVKIEKSGDITITAEGKLTLKGKQVEISGDTTVKVAGQTIDLN